MKIEDLIQLLDNRLREFKLSKDYAKMNGDLKRMNDADKEVIALEDTLYKLNLLVDTSKSAAVKKDILAEVITDGSVAVLGEYDITLYATDPKHEEKVMNILSKMGVMDTVEKIDDYINWKYPSSPVTGEMIMSAGLAYDVDVRLMMAMMEQDSSLGTAGKAVRTLNPGNVGNDDSGNLRTYESWQEGVTAVAEWLNRHRGSTIISEIPEETVVEPTTPATASSPSFPFSATASTSEETMPLTTSTTTTTATSPSFPFSPTPTPEVTTSTTTTTTASSSFSPTPTPTTTPIVTASPSPTSSPSFSPTPTPEITTSTTTTITTPTSTPQPSPEASAGTEEPSPSPTQETTPSPTPDATATEAELTPATASSSEETIN